MILLMALETRAPTCSRLPRNCLRVKVAPSRCHPEEAVHGGGVI